MAYFCRSVLFVQNNKKPDWQFFVQCTIYSAQKCITYCDVVDCHLNIGEMGLFGLHGS